MAFRLLLQTKSGQRSEKFHSVFDFGLLPLMPVQILAMRKNLNGAVLLQMVGMRPCPTLIPASNFQSSVSLLQVVAQVDNQYPFEISPSPTFTQMDPYKPQYKVPRSISEEELIR